MEDPILRSAPDFPDSSSLSRSTDAPHTPDRSNATTSTAVETALESLDGSNISSPPSDVSMRSQCGSDNSIQEDDQFHDGVGNCEDSLIGASSNSHSEPSKVNVQEVLFAERPELAVSDALGLSVRSANPSRFFSEERHESVEECEVYGRESNGFGPATAPNGPVGSQDFDRKLTRYEEAIERIESPLVISKRESTVPIDNLTEDADRLSGVGAGLLNLGNTCFMNSILQCFTHTIPLIKALRSFNHDFPCGSSEFCVFCALRDHIELSIVSPGKVISPLAIFNNLNYISSCFQRYQQEDAHEFLQCFLDKLDSSCMDSNSPEKGYGASANNIVDQVFGGRLVSKLWCNNCGHCSERFEPLIDMSLEIEEVGTLESALESFTRVEKLDDADVKMLCESCKKETTIKKQLMLDHLPHVASFHLKRFKTDGYVVDKINKHISFPLELDLNPFTNRHQENGQGKYKLFAVVVHYGYLPTSGHYLTYVRSSPTTWYRLDDSLVTRISEEEVFSEAAYILLYTEESSPWFSDFAEQQEQGTTYNSSDTSPKSDQDILEVAEHAELTLVEACHKSTVDTEEKSAEVSVSPVRIDIAHNNTPMVDVVFDDYDEQSVKVEFAFSPKNRGRADTPRTNGELPGEEHLSHSYKRSKKSPELDPEKREALRYVSRSFMPSSRKTLLLSAMSPKSDRSRSRAYPCKKTVSPGNSRRIDHNVAVSR